MWASTSRLTPASSWEDRPGGSSTPDAQTGQGTTMRPVVAAAAAALVQACDAKPRWAAQKGRPQPEQVKGM